MLDFIPRYMEDAMAAQGSIADRLALQERYEEQDVILAAYENQVIRFQADTDMTQSDDAIASLIAADRLRVDRDIYFTEVFPDRQLISFDGVEWFENDSDLENGIEALRPYFEAEWSKTANELTLILDWHMLPGENPRLRRGPRNRSVVVPEPGMVLGAERRRDVTHPLNRYVLRVPAGTEVGLDVSVDSNLFSLSADEGRLELFTDLYFYRGEGLPSVSFDNEDWSINIFSFEFETTNGIYVDDSGRIVFSNELTLIKRD